MRIHTLIYKLTFSDSYVYIQYVVRGNNSRIKNILYLIPKPGYLYPNTTLVEIV